VVNDGSTPGSTVADILDALGFDVCRARIEEGAASLLARTRPDLIILELMRADEDGLVLCAEIRANTDLPVVLCCSATSQRRDAILGLKLGADACITWPIDMYELGARLEAVLRRTSRPVDVPARGSNARPNELHVGALTIDRSRFTATLGGQFLTLTPTEYRLLVALSEHADRVISRKELASLVWGTERVGKGRTLDVHIARLRSKLGSTGVTPPLFIGTVRGFGYRIIGPRQSS